MLGWTSLKVKAALAPEHQHRPGTLCALLGSARNETHALLHAMQSYCVLSRLAFFQDLGELEFLSWCTMNLEHAITFWCIFLIVPFLPHFFFFPCSQYVRSFAGDELLCLLQDPGTSLKDLSCHWAASPASSANLLLPMRAQTLQRTCLNQAIFALFPCHVS